MPRPMLDSPYLFGLHDPGGEWLMAQSGRRGWVLFTEAVGSDPNDRSGVDYRPYSDQDYGVMVRINNGYGAVGTIPAPENYPVFAQRVANFVAASPGCRIWIIGNEMNHSQEWPQSGAARALGAPASGAAVQGVDQDPFGRGSPTRFSALQPQVRAAAPALASARAGLRPILPADYINCFRRCREAIRALPGHGGDLVVIGAVAPWNAELTYPANPIGDWIVYFTDILNALGPAGCDGIALHTYTHGSDPALIADTSTMNPPFQNRYFHFQAYRNFMNAIPANMRALPVFITETDQDISWLDRNNGWVQAAYAEIDRWNRQPAAQQIRALLLYRWRRDDQWYIDGKNGVMDDFRAALANDYRWRESPPSPAQYKVGDVVRTLTQVNLRAAPGGQVIGVVPAGVQATVRSTPPTMSGGLPHWPVRLLFNGEVRNGWLAQYTLDGIVLLAQESFGTLRPADYRQGEQVRTLDVVNFRRQPAGPVLGPLAKAALLTVSDPIFVMADGLPYWSVRGLLNGTTVDGWVAQYTQNGVVLLERQQPRAVSGAPAATLAVDPFVPGALVRTKTAVRMRRTPGSTNKPASDTIALVAVNTTLLLQQGPVQADGMAWWKASGQLPALGQVEGWVARQLPDGELLLEVAAPPAIEPPKYTFVPGNRFQTTTSVRLRRTAGFVGKGPTDIVAEVGPGVVGTIAAGPASVDGLLWWQVQNLLQQGQSLAGWIAEATTGGEVLLQKIADPVTPPGLRVGALVVTADFVNVRKSPGSANKPADDVQGALRPQTTAVLLQGPQQVDGLAWWRAGAILTPPGGEVRGWLAEATPGSGALLKPARVLPGTTLPNPETGTYLSPPFEGRYPIGQLWGENSAFYARFKYDGVALLGHNGVDFSTPVGVELWSLESGVVAQIGFEAGGFGNYLLVRHAWGESLYAHLSTVDVALNQPVSRRQRIGRSGNTGGSTGPHLHLAIRVAPYMRTDGWGGFSDPLPYLPPDCYTLPAYILDPLSQAATVATERAVAPLRLAPSGMGDIPGQNRP
ncbi:MAG: M23 family metallopeptidase [Caldilinea sp.]